MIGFSEGNGHPFSFSAIVNGYNSDLISNAGWSGIQEYLDKKNPADFNIHNAQVTHVWCPSRELSQKIASACNIDCVEDQYQSMLGKVDALIIARDDFESHLEIARVFLESGACVFIDKPLTLDLNELAYFEKFLLKGQLMSHSGFRHCVELDDARLHYKGDDSIAFANAVVVNDWEKYGIHMVDALLGLTQADPVSVSAQCNKEICTYVVQMDDACVFNITTTGKLRPIFSVQLIGRDSRFEVEITDNFAAFKRTLIGFLSMVVGELDHQHASDTIKSIKTLIAGKISRERNGKEIFLDSLY